MMLMLLTSPCVCKQTGLLNNCCISLHVGAYVRWSKYFLGLKGYVIFPQLRVKSRSFKLTGYWWRRAPSDAAFFTQAAHKQKQHKPKRFNERTKQEHGTYLFTSPSPAHYHFLNKFGLCSIGVHDFCKGHRAGGDWKSPGGSAGPLCDHAMAALVSLFPCRCSGIPEVADFPALSLERKDISPVQVEQEERVRCCEGKLTGCNVLHCQGARKMWHPVRSTGGENN